MILQKYESTVGLSGEAHHEKFDLSLDNLISKSYFDVQKNETFSQTGFNLILNRNPTKFIMNIYIPTFLLTVASFIGFLIPVELVPGRMALLVTIFLMLVNMSSVEQNRGPIVKGLLLCFYVLLTLPLVFQTRKVTAMDIWMFICMIFVILAKLQYAVQLKIHFGTTSHISNAGTKDTKKRWEKRGKMIDRYALVAFLVSYILTVWAYFYIYL